MVPENLGEIGKAESEGGIRQDNVSHILNICHPTEAILSDRCPASSAALS